MNLRRTLAALAVVLVLGASLQAGPPIVVVGPPGIAVGIAGPRIRGGVVFGGYALPYGGPFYGGYRSSSLTIIGAPPVSSPNITININNNVAAPSPVQAAPMIDVRDEDFPDKIVVRPRRPAPVEKAAMRPDEPLPGEPAGNFRPLQPEDRDRVKPPPDVPPPKPFVPAPKEDEFTRLMRLGAEAFASQEYGRAERRFLQATEESPKEPLPHFYLGQACFALGKYQEAVAAIHAGLRLDANWPSSRFKARDLYGANGGDFIAHFGQLDAARTAAPNDPVLLFLSAYQMWFDNRQEDARPLFRRAARLVAEPRFLDLFLLAQPGGAVAAR